VAGGQARTTAGPDGKFVLTGLNSARYRLSAGSGPSQSGLYRISSIRLGEREIRDTGFDSPYQGNGTLRIAIECTPTGRRQ